MRGIFWLAEWLLASQEWLCSIELVNLVREIIWLAEWLLASQEEFWSMELIS
jgi:hypothetical protein